LGKILRRSKLKQVTAADEFVIDIELHIQMIVIDIIAGA
jgi:hypothetical protein